MNALHIVPAISAGSSSRTVFSHGHAHFVTNRQIRVNSFFRMKLHNFMGLFNSVYK